MKFRTISDNPIKQDQLDTVVINAPTIVNLYRNGYTMTEIAEKYEIETILIYEFLKQHNQKLTQ